MSTIVGLIHSISPENLQQTYSSLIELENLLRSNVSNAIVDGIASTIIKCNPFPSLFSILSLDAPTLNVCIVLSYTLNSYVVSCTSIHTTTEFVLLSIEQYLWYHS